MSNLRRVTALLIALLAVGALITYGPGFLADRPRAAPSADRWQAVADARTVLVQVLIGAGAIVSALYAAKTFILSRASQQNDRFASAIESLGNQNSIAVRQGGVHTLYLLTEERQSFWPAAQELLCAFVVERLSLRTQSDSAEAYPDVQAALSALGKRPSFAVGAPMKGPGLENMNLAGFNLMSANLERARLSNSKLQGALLSDAIMSHVYAADAAFEGADLAGADLRNATLTKCNFASANMLKARLDGAHVADAEFANAINMRSGQLRHCTGQPGSAPP